MSKWDTVKRVVNEASFSRLEVTTGSSEEKALKDALLKFSKKYGQVSLSTIKSGSGDYGSTYGITVGNNHLKGLQVVVAMALKKHKMSIGGKSVYGG